MHLDLKEDCRPIFFELRLTLDQQHLAELAATLAGVLARGVLSQSGDRSAGNALAQLRVHTVRPRVMDIDDGRRKGEAGEGYSLVVHLKSVEH